LTIWRIAAAMHGRREVEDEFITRVDKMASRSSRLT
jgi:hypothetical protein